MSQYDERPLNRPHEKTNWLTLSDAQRLRGHAEMAKHGVSINGSNDCSRSEMLEHRSDLRRLTNLVRDEAQELLNKKGHAWASEDEKQFNDKMELIDTFGAWVDRQNDLITARDMGDQVMASMNTKPNVWRAPDGKIIHVLAKDQRMTDLPDNNHHSSDPVSSINFGEVIRGMALGTQRPDIRAALTEGTDAAGGFTVPPRLLRDLIDRMRARTFVIQAGAQTVLLETMKTSMVRIGSDPTAAWRAEAAIVPESDTTFEKVEFVARSLAVMVKVSRELLEDTINLEEALVQVFTGSMAVELDRVALFGSGTAPEPRGIFNTTNVGSISMGVNGAAITNYDPLIDLLSNLQTANAPEPTAAIMAPRTSTVLAKLKDSTNQPLRKPEALATLPFMVTTQVPITQTQGTATNASTVIAGDFKQVMIGIRRELHIELLRERYAENMMYAFLVHMRADVQVARPAALAKLVGIIP